MIIDEVLPAGMLGEWDPDDNVIRIDPRQSARQYLCTLAHEWEHWRADHRPTGDCHVDGVIESEASQRAARKLINIRALAEAAAAYPDDAERIALELQVDVDTLVARLRHLHPSERHLLQRRLEHARESA